MASEVPAELRSNGQDRMFTIKGCGSRKIGRRKEGVRATQQHQTRGVQGKFAGQWRNWTVRRSVLKATGCKKPGSLGRLGILSGILTFLISTCGGLSENNCLLSRGTSVLPPVCLSSPGHLYCFSLFDKQRCISSKLILTTFKIMSFSALLEELLGQRVPRLRKLLKLISGLI